MTISDKWLLDLARQRKNQGTPSKPGRPALPPVDKLWVKLQDETKRQAAVYTGALGDPKALVVETGPDTIEVRVPDGRQMTLRLDKKQRTLSETFRDRAGALRPRRPTIGFALDADGGLTFTFGGLQAAAGSLLRRVIS